MGRKIKAKKRNIELRFDETVISPEEQKYRNERLTQVILRMGKELESKKVRHFDKKIRMYLMRGEKRLRDVKKLFI